LRRKTPKDLWREDLDAFITELDVSKLITLEKPIPTSQRLKETCLDSLGLFHVVGNGLGVRNFF
jgi:hypothetical protein